MFGKDGRDDGHTQLLRYSVNTSGAAPIKKTQITSKSSGTEQQIKQVAADNLITETNVAMACAIFYGRKKDGSLRF